MKLLYKQIPVMLLYTALCLLLITLTACGTLNDMPGYENAHTPDDVPHTESPGHDEIEPDNGTDDISVTDNDDEPPQNTPEENLDITLELAQYTPQEITLFIANNSGFDIRYGGDISVTFITTGGSRGWSYNYDTFDLAPGETQKITVLPRGQDGFQLGFGEIRLSKVITIEPDDPSAARTQRIHVDFAIENTDIPPDLSDIVIEVYFETPIGVLTRITNGFENGRLYYDKSFRLTRIADGIPHDIPAVGPEEFPDDSMRSVSSRQILDHHIIYWEWLYGEMTSGQYRIEKTFWHRDDDGNITTHKAYAEFELDGEPVPDIIHGDDGSMWHHPFSSIVSFKAEVLGLLDPTFYSKSLFDTGLGVKGLTPIWDGDRVGSRYFFWDDTAVTVLDSDGKQMKFTDILPGAIVEISFSGFIYDTYPGEIYGVLLVRVES